MSDHSATTVGAYTDSHNLTVHAETVHVSEPTFEDVLWMLISVSFVWVAGKAVTRVGLPSLVGEICVGVVLGPPLLNFVPMPEALMLFGEVGLMLLVLEAGLDVDLEMLKLIGLRGVGIAITGSLVPLLLGAILSATVLGLEWRASLAVGCALAPTSMGIALNVLKRAKVLNTPTGQLIIAAAVLDDVIALILLSELQALGDPTLLHLLTPIAASLGLMLGIGWVAVYVMPPTMGACMAWVPAKRQEKVLLGLVLGLAIVLVPTCHALGSSHLLGAFLAGLSFCTDKHVHKAWSKQVKRVLHWLLKIFFAATIGFEVPVRSFADPAVVGHACVLVLAVAGKFATGMWAMPLTRENFFTVGLAMSAWGEFAFITATTARMEGIMGASTFSSVILAVVLSVILAPTLLRCSLERAQRAAEARIGVAIASQRGGAAPSPTRGGACVTLGGDAAPPVCYHLQTVSAPAWGLNGRLMRAIGDSALNILDFRSAPAGAQVANELYLEDQTLRAPPTHELSTEHAEVVRGRVGGLLRVLSPLFSDGGKVELVRWLPDADADAEGGTSAPPAADAAAAAVGVDAGAGVDANASANAAAGVASAVATSSTHVDVPPRDGRQLPGPPLRAGPSHRARPARVPARAAPTPRASWWARWAPAGTGSATDEERRGYKEQRPTDLSGFFSTSGRSNLLQPQPLSEAVEWATPIDVDGPVERL